MKLSIIVPVYNVEDYITQCLNSLLDQDLGQDDYEIIIVNDGSNDSSDKIANEYVQRHKNVQIINRENGGLSAARNTGLKNAKGEYVWFVDSDDWIEANSLNTLIRLLDKNELDVLCFGVKCYHNAEHIDSSNSPTEYVEQVMHGADFVSKVKMIPAAWAAVYRRSFLSENKLTFYEGILHEDEEFTPRAYFLANKIMYLHKHVYYYRQREGSIMKSARNAKRAVDYLTIADSLYDFALKHTQEGSDQYYYFMQRVNRQVVQSLYFNTGGMPPFALYREKKYFPLTFANLKCKQKDKLKYLLVNISPKLYYLIRKIQK